MGTSLTTRGGLARSKNIARTLDRALFVLSCFTDEEPEYSLAALTARLGVNVSTAHRYVNTLEAAGYLAKDLETHRYSLGLTLVELAGTVLNHSDVRRHAQEELDVLTTATGMNANLAVLHREDAFHLAYAVAIPMGSGYTRIGRRAVAHCTALGKTLLAHQPRYSVHEVIADRGWRPYTPYSIRDFATLDRELDRVRVRGYAVDKRERHIGTCCLAAPIRARRGAVIAAMSICAHREGFTEEEERMLAETVCRCADRVSRKMGYNGDDF